MSQENVFIADLNKILNVFANSHFLAILTDFRKVAFAEVNHPIILRKLRLAWVEKMKLKDNKDGHYPVYVQEKVLVRNKRVTESYRRPHVSPFCHWSTHQHLLPVLSISSYWKRSRSWNNIVFVALFPHIRHPQHLDKFSLGDHEISNEQF